MSSIRRSNHLLTVYWQRKQKRKQQSSRTAEQVVLTVFVISLSITVVCILGRERLLRLVFGTVDDTVMENSLVYFMITVISYPFLALFSAKA